MIETAERSVTFHPKWLLRCGATIRHIETSISSPKLEGHEYAKMVRRYGDRIQEFARKGLGLYLYGPYGTGKTSLAVYVMKEVMGRAGRTILVRAGEVKDLIINRVEFEPGVTYAEMMDSVDVLVVDNLNSDLSRAWASERFEDLIRHRWNQKRPTVITSNVSPGDLEDVVTAGAASLIRDACIPVLVEGVQWRKALTDEILRGD